MLTLNGNRDLGAVLMTNRQTQSSIPLDEGRFAAFMNQRDWTQRVGSVGEPIQHRSIFLEHVVLAVRTGACGALMMPADHGADADILGDALRWLRRSGSDDVLIWSATSDRDFDRLLTAHGGRDSFRPQWMFRQFDVRLEPSSNNSLAHIRPVRTDDLPELLLRSDIPYSSRWHAYATVHLSTQASSDQPMATMVALVEEEIVGRGLINLSTTAIGRVAGFYDVAVAPQWQGQGIGIQLIEELMRTAEAMGAEYGTLNATPAAASLYRRLGFRDAGTGQTWLLPGHTLRHPPSAALIQFALAISGGESLVSASRTERLAAHELPNGDTPLAHAARFDQPESARRLLSLGTIPDVAALWDMGLRDEARTMMTERGALNTPRGSQRVAPIHVAIHWDDVEFLEALLDAGADPYVRDGTFDGDAWGWCHALGNEDALTLIADYHPEQR